MPRTTHLRAVLLSTLVFLFTMGLVSCSLQDNSPRSHSSESPHSSATNSSESSDDSSSSTKSTSTSTSSTSSSNTKDASTTKEAKDAQNKAGDSWTPRTIDTPRGPVTIEKQPERIVSTSVTLTGSLLAIDAPLIATGAAGSSGAGFISDDKGFFLQWAKVADDRGVEKLYELQEPNLEAVLASNPDLILVSSRGADSIVAKNPENYDKLAELGVPIVEVDYTDKSWEEITTFLGTVTGREKAAQDTIDSYNDRLHSLKERITLPDQPTLLLSYSTNAGTARVWSPESAQGRLLTSLGFTLPEIEERFVDPTQLGKGRRDASGISPEMLHEALESGRSWLVLQETQDPLADLRANPTLEHSTALVNSQAYTVPGTFFRLDYYSSMQMLDAVEELFVS